MANSAMQIVVIFVNTCKTRIVRPGSWNRNRVSACWPLLAFQAKRTVKAKDPSEKAERIQVMNCCLHEHPSFLPSPDVKSKADGATWFSNGHGKSSSHRLRLHSAGGSNFSRTSNNEVGIHASCNWAYYSQFEPLLRRYGHQVEFIEDPRKSFLIVHHLSTSARTFVFPMAAKDYLTCPSGPVFLESFASRYENTGLKKRSNKNNVPGDKCCEPKII
jgi:hypothetical protein